LRIGPGVGAQAPCRKGFMPQPICVTCEREMRPEKNGAIVEYFDEDLQSYKLLSGDIWKCNMCGREIVCGLSRSPLSERWHLDYAEKLASYPERIKVFV